MKNNTEYSFKYRGALSGKHAFTLAGIDELRRKVRQVESGSGISAGINGIEQLGETRPDDDATAVSAEDFKGAGWYLTHFDGSAERYDTEAEALVAYIEDRTETREG
jgi:hypothetical protein